MEKAIVLLGEYDMPLQDAWLNGFWDDSVNFLPTVKVALAAMT